MLTLLAFFDILNVGVVVSSGTCGVVALCTGDVGGEPTDIMVSKH